MRGRNQGRNRSDRRKAYRLGLSAEGRAAFFLRLKGWRILARRYKAATGEIDIVALKGDTVAFVEVKARASREAALLAITPAAQRRIASAARIWQAENPWSSAYTLRFDAVLAGRGFRLSHVQNVFEGR
ncbi:YraN family protein [Rhizobiales bacterium]|uniref:YraN family protein n=1 Tax=Hongsoonwoonella zoysiae TaxID=2821844 RepID=UPI0015608752|nr:YraN family protein [Hongsoonwoonella zoysiae]